MRVYRVRTHTGPMNALVCPAIPNHYAGLIGDAIPSIRAFNCSAKYNE